MTTLRYGKAKSVKDALTLPQLLAWAKTKNPDEEYNYCSNQQCAIAQYLIAQGFGYDRVGVGATVVNRPQTTPIPENIKAALNYMGARHLDRRLGIFTFAQLVEALEAQP